MDQIQREKVLEKLGKIKALAERGVGGEKETALRIVMDGRTPPKAAIEAKGV